jgi:replicative DNA helicase
MSAEQNILESMPYARDAEMGVLSCLFHTPTLLAPEALAMPVDCFYHPAHRMLFEVIVEFLRNGRPVEYVVLSQHLVDTKQMDKIGGQGFLAELLNFVPTPTHWGYYVSILKDKLYLRTVIQQCALVRQSCYDFQDEPRKVLLNALAEFSELATDNPGNKRRWIPVAESVDLCMQRTEERIRSRGKVPKGAVATGFTDLDRRTMGLMPGELFIIGARPAMGKSALAANMAECIVLANGHYREFEQPPMPVGLVSLEMNHADISERILVGRSQVDMGKTRTGMFSRMDQQNYLKACAELSKAPLHFLDTGRLSVQELAARCRHDVERLGLKVLVVDYLQRMCSDSKRSQQNRSVEIGEISSGLKGIAKDYNVVVIGLAQVGRSAEDRAESKPTLSDLRESGDIEADADFVGLLWRPGYYARRKSKSKAKRDGAGEEDDISDDTAQLIMAKMRRGAPEPIDLNWDGPRTRFTSTHDRLFSNNDAKREG